MVNNRNANNPPMVSRSAVTALVLPLLLVAGSFMTGPTPAWAAPPTAIVDINEEAWVQGRRDTLGDYAGVSVTRAYAPMPVFLEGWESTPREEIKEYRWDFGIGSAKPDFTGFNAAHVYETPGTYTITLTVENYAGEISTASIGIEVLAPDGVTYYVDAELGDDTNAGTSLGAGAWKTAAHAFGGMTNRRYGPGDRILFTRGQEFQMSTTDFPAQHWQHGYGYMLGATAGDGHKPVIQATGGASGTMLLNNKRGMAFVSFVDLNFRMKTSTGQRLTLYNGGGLSQNTMFLRCIVQDMYQSFLFGNIECSGTFIVESNFYNSSQVQVWGEFNRLALLRNNFDQSDNHILYLSTINKGVITGNLVSRPASGRTAMRISNSEADVSTNNVVVSHNRFEGWLDPDTGGSAHRDGTSYGWNLVHLAPNGQAVPQIMHDILFEHNVLKNAETLLNIGSYENLVVRNNVFTTVSSKIDSLIIFGSKHNFDQRPLRNITFVNNIIKDHNGSSAGGFGAIFEIRKYPGPAYLGRTRHEGIRIMDNDIHVLSGMTRILFFTQDDVADVQEVWSDRNRVYHDIAMGDDLFQIGGTRLAPTLLFNLAEWQGFAYFDTTNTPPYVRWDDPHDGTADTFGGDDLTTLLAPVE